MTQKNYLSNTKAITIKVLSKQETVILSKKMPKAAIAIEKHLAKKKKKSPLLTPFIAPQTWSINMQPWALLQAPRYQILAMTYRNSDIANSTSTCKAKTKKKIKVHIWVGRVFDCLMCSASECAFQNNQENKQCFFSFLYERKSYHSLLPTAVCCFGTVRKTRSLDTKILLWLFPSNLVAKFLVTLLKSIFHL